MNVAKWKFTSVVMFIQKERNVRRIYVAFQDSQKAYIYTIVSE